MPRKNIRTGEDLGRKASNLVKYVRPLLPQPFRLFLHSFAMPSTDSTASPVIRTSAENNLQIIWELLFAQDSRCRNLPVIGKAKPIFERVLGENFYRVFETDFNAQLAAGGLKQAAWALRRYLAKTLLPSATYACEKELLRACAALIVTLTCFDALKGQMPETLTEMTGVLRQSAPDQTYIAIWQCSYALHVCFCRNICGQVMRDDPSEDEFVKTITGFKTIPSMTLAALAEVFGLLKAEKLSSALFESAMANKNLPTPLRGLARLRCAQRQTELQTVVEQLSVAANECAVSPDNRLISEVAETLCRVAKQSDVQELSRVIDRLSGRATLLQYAFAQPKNLEQLSNGAMSKKEVTEHLLDTYTIFFE